MSNLVPPVNATEISKLASVTRATVSNWRKRHEDFPKPIGGTDSRPVFDWNAVQAWMADRGADASDAPILLLRTLLRSALPVAAAQDLLTALEPTKYGWLATDSVAKTDGVTDILQAMEAAAKTDGPRAALHALADHAHGGEQNLGRYRTPDLVANLMAGLLEPIKATSLQRVLDPACGSGSLLAAAAAYGAAELYGQDISETQAALARLVVRAETGVDASIAVGDSLHDDAFPNLEVDAVLSSPLSERDWGAERLRLDDPRWLHGTPGRMDSDMAWVQHALAHTRPGGLAVLLLPAPAASKASGRRIRSSLLRSGTLRAVIGLPPRIPQLLWTRLNLQIWILEKPAPDTPAADSVLLVDATPTGSTPSGTGDAIDWSSMAEAVQRVWSAYYGARPADAEEPNVSTVVRVVDLLDDAVDLMPAPRVKLAIDPGIVAGETDTAMSRLRTTVSELTQAVDVVGRVEQISGTSWRTATILDLSSGGAVRVLRYQPPKSTVSAEADERLALTGRDIATGGPATGIVKLEPGGSAIEVEAGDVLIPTVRGTRGQAFRVAGPDEAGTVLGPHVQLLRTDPQRLDPWFIAGFIGGVDDAISGRTTAIQSAMHRTRIPLLPLAQQQRYGATFRGVHQLRAALAQASAAGDQLAEMVTSGLVAGALAPSENSTIHEDNSISRGGSE